MLRQCRPHGIVGFHGVDDSAEVQQQLGEQPGSCPDIGNAATQQAPFAQVFAQCCRVAGASAHVRACTGGKACGGVRHQIAAHSP